MIVKEVVPEVLLAVSDAEQVIVQLPTESVTVAVVPAAKVTPAVLQSQ